MTIQDIGAIGEFVGSMLILVTLIYLAVQNKQQQKLLSSQAYQARTDTTLSLFSQAISNLQFAEKLANMEGSEALTPGESLQLLLWFSSSMKSHENTHFQHQLGVLPDEHITSIRKVVKLSMHSPAWRQFWSLNKEDYRGSFVIWVDEIIQEVELG